jgi:hypothetical protein
MDIRWNAGRRDSVQLHGVPALRGAMGVRLRVAFWRGLRLSEDGRRRIAVNLRLAEPESVAQIPIDHFDGFDRFDDLPRDGRCVRDYWF